MEEESRQGWEVEEKRSHHADYPVGGEAPVKPPTQFLEILYWKHTSCYQISVMITQKPVPSSVKLFRVS